MGIHTRLIEIYVLTGCLIESRVSPPRYKDHAPCPLATPPLRLLAPLLPLLLLVLLPFSLHSFAHSRRDSVQHPLGGLDMSSVSTSDEPGPSHLHESSELASLQEREETPTWEPRYVAKIVCMRAFRRPDLLALRPLCSALESASKRAACYERQIKDLEVRSVPLFLSHLLVMRRLRRRACYICLSLGDVFSSTRRQPFCLHRVCPRAQSHASRAQSAVWLPWNSVGRYLTLGHGGLHMRNKRCRGVYINFTYELLPGLPQSM